MLLGCQIRAARGLLDLSQIELAKISRISLPTIKRIENQDGPLAGRPKTIEALHRALQRKGIDFIPEGTGGAGVRLAKPQRRGRA